ncbi:MAG TPA: NYN domain-containing protein [Bacteroidia bacterium]|nr:NYN domain-containing protein [Bacteroidia bacterium]
MSLKSFFSKTRPEEKASVKTGVAVIIDAENVSPKNIHAYLKEVAAFGNISIKEAYGSGTLLASPTWKNALLLHAIEPRQVLNIKRGKNTSDIEIAVRAMELHYEEKPAFICIISGDTDYSPVLQKLRAKKQEVLVIAKEVSDSYFHSTGNLIFEKTIQGIGKSDAQTISKRKPVRRPAPVVANTTAKASQKTVAKPLDYTLIDRAFAMTPVGKSGYPTAGNFNSAIKKLDSNFNYANYGCRSFTAFIASLRPRYEIIRDENKTVFVKKVS